MAGASESDPLEPPDRERIVVWTDTFPELSETFISAEVKGLRKRGRSVRVEAGARAAHPDRVAASWRGTRFLEDDGLARKALDLAWLLARHPIGCASDLLARVRWRREEPVWPLRSLAPVARRLVRGGERHVHVHFAASAALNAMRIARLTGQTYSVTAHAYEIFRAPANLEEKLSGAAFTTTGCAYNVRHLSRTLPGPPTRNLHEVVMGVDGERFRRSKTYPATGTVLAVGRLVEKKGFAYLVEAVAHTPRVQRLVIAGDGELREELSRLADSAGVADRVDLLGPVEHERVRELLEQASLLAMPCVVAADGDRDSMPVVVKEALAMEVPVVATDEVGLPEVVRDAWGRLVAPRDPAALAAAIDELLALPAEQRAAMGRAGREFVLEHCSVAGQAARVDELAAQVLARPS